MSDKQSTVAHSAEMPIGSTESKLPLLTCFEDTVRAHAAMINGHLQQGMTCLFEAGKALISATESLEHGDLQKLYAPGVLVVDERTAQKLMKIARHPFLSNPNNWSDLPSAMSSLYLLTQMSNEKIREMIISKNLSPSSTSKEITSLIAKSKGFSVDPTCNAFSQPEKTPSLKEAIATDPNKEMQALIDSIKESTSEFITKNPSMAVLISICLKNLASQIDAYRCNNNLFAKANSD